jgi:hypothetical protein
MDRLKLLNEKTIAVGNSGLNARGDLVKGNKILKSREEIMQETYNLSGNNVVKDAKKNKSNINNIQPDPVSMMNPYEKLLGDTNEVRTVIPTPAGSPRGGLASAVQKSTDIAAVLDTQRKRI